LSKNRLGKDPEPGEGICNEPVADCTDASGDPKSP